MAHKYLASRIFSSRLPSRNTQTPRTSVPSLRDHLANVNAAASSARNAWITFIGVMAFFAVSLAGISHKDLLFNSFTQLPLVNARIPVTGLFAFGPLVLLFFHFGVLLQHAHLYRKLLAFNDALGAPPRTRLDKGDIRDELHSYFMVQSVVGKNHERSVRWADRLMTTATFIIVPVVVLFYFQLKFLPYHHSDITWAHRIILLMDVGVILTVGAFLFNIGKEGSAVQTQTRQSTSGFERFRITVLSGSRIIMFLSIMFSLFVLTIPDETVDIGLFDKIFKNTRLQLNRNLQLVHLDLASDKAIDKGETILIFRERDFRYADFTSSNFSKADFSNSNFFGADLLGANLRGTDFSSSQLQKANLMMANIQGADFTQADLQGAILIETHLEGADFMDADLQGADLSNANLQGASLILARLQGTNLSQAQLQGADLAKAQLQGANLSKAQLQGANLSETQLQGANLAFTSIWYNVELSDAQIDLANFQEIRVKRGDIKKTIKDLRDWAEKDRNNNALQERIEHLEEVQSAFDERAPEKSWHQYRKQSFCAWQRLRNQPAPNPIKHGASLGKLACIDDSPKAYTANMLAISLLELHATSFYPFPKPVKAVYTESPNTHRRPTTIATFIHELDDCPAVREKIAADTMNQLQQAAKEPLPEPLKAERVEWDPKDGISPAEADKICASSTP